MFRYIVAGLVGFLLLFFVFVVKPYITEVTCPYCNGKAFITRGIIQVPCLYCKGAGTVANYAKPAILEIMAKEQKEEMEKKKKDEEEMKKQEEKWRSESSSEPEPREFQGDSQE